MSAPGSLDRVFSGAALGSLALLVALVIADASLPDPDAECRGFRNCGSQRNSVPDRVLAKFNDMRRPRITREQADAELHGYYEGLFRESGRAVATNALVSGRWAADWTAWESQQLRGDAIQRRDDFLLYEMIPGLESAEFGVRFSTNSVGMADREYPLERREGQRRVAYIGDSVLRGLGATFGSSFEALLEDSLNAAPPTGPGTGYEFLNFGVEAYRITQFIEVMRTKAAEYRPDAYVLCLTRLSVGRKWADHLGQLLAEGVDLQYDFLRDLTRRARLRPADDMVTMETKLGPYRAETFDWALRSMRDMAEAQGAGFLVLLLPSADPPEFSEVGFDETRQVLAETGIPNIDLLDAFGSVGDLTPYRLNEFDGHPNDLGHRLLFEQLLEALEDDPVAWGIVSGVSPDR